MLVLRIESDSSSLEVFYLFIVILTIIGHSLLKVILL